MKLSIKNFTSYFLLAKKENIQQFHFTPNCNKKKTQNDQSLAKLKIRKIFFSIHFKTLEIIQIFFLNVANNCFKI